MRRGPSGHQPALCGRSCCCCRLDRTIIPGPKPYCRTGESGPPGALWLHNFYPTGEQWYTNFKPQSGCLCSRLSKLHHILTLFRDAGERPDVWFEPEEVWEIRGADLSLSPVRVLKGGRERGGHTWLFFPACTLCGMPAEHLIGHS